jgi:hypothetical protein
LDSNSVIVGIKIPVKQVGAHGGRKILLAYIDTKYGQLLRSVMEKSRFTIGLTDQERRGFASWRPTSMLLRMTERFGYMTDKKGQHGWP